MRKLLGLFCLLFCSLIFANRLEKTITFSDPAEGKEIGFVSVSMDFTVDEKSNQVSETEEDKSIEKFPEISASGSFSLKKYWNSVLKKYFGEDKTEKVNLVDLLPRVSVVESEPVQVSILIPNKEADNGDKGDWFKHSERKHDSFLERWFGNSKHHDEHDKGGSRNKNYHGKDLHGSILEKVFGHKSDHHRRFKDCDEDAKNFCDLDEPISRNNINEVAICLKNVFNENQKDKSLSSSCENLLKKSPKLACVDDVEKFCPIESKIPRRNHHGPSRELVECMELHKDELSTVCSDAIAAKYGKTRKEDEKRAEKEESSKAVAIIPENRADNEVVNIGAPKKIRYGYHSNSIEESKTSAETGRISKLQIYLILSGIVLLALVIAGIVYSRCRRSSENFVNSEIREPISPVSDTDSYLYTPVGTVPPVAKVHVIEFAPVPKVNAP